MRDFKQQLKQYGDERKKARCPYSEAELDKEIRSVVWGVERGERRTKNGERRTHQHTLRSPLKWVAAAALVAAIVIPTAISTSRVSTTDGIASVKVDGEHAYFACNNGCSAISTIETFKTLLR